MDSNVGSVSKSSQVHQQHLQNEAQLRYQLYNQTAQSLLAARAKVQQESPVLVVLQPGIAPHIGKPSKVKLTILWFILGGLAGAVWCVLKASWSQEKTVVSEEYSTEYKEGMEQYYPVNDEKNNKLAEKYHAMAAKEKDVVFGGRLAEYKYYDMAPIIEKVFTLF